MIHATTENATLGWWRSLDAYVEPPASAKKSWINTARALYDYFNFLQAHDLRWDDVSRGGQKTLVAAYRDYCLEEYDPAPTTVRDRLV
ncbi:hypothetical protein [Burkholderia territorii]|uniref:hypothetical protein n=1 Tax=Burkholderia territorii TaxID=1503055 RepID=UPI000ACE77E7|nr:hypothetical protein [Burkholderia territorii]